MTICRDLDRLDPTFRPMVESIVLRMRARGFDAKVFETWRSFERAQELSKTGAGVRRSMHCYGLAVDIISESVLWAASRDFWAALGAEAHMLDLTWGGDWHRRGTFRAHEGQFTQPYWDWPEDEGKDCPHIQAVPIKTQNRVRRGSVAETAALVAQLHGPRQPEGVA